MSFLIIIMTSWKSDLPPAHSSPCRDLEIATQQQQQQQCARGCTRGGVQPSKSLQTSLIRDRTCGHTHAPSPDHFEPKEGTIQQQNKNKKKRIREITLSCAGLARRGRRCARRMDRECCTMTDNAFAITRARTHLRCFLAGFIDAGIWSVTAGPPRAAIRRFASASLWGESAQDSVRVFVDACVQVAAYLRGCSHTVDREALQACFPLWEFAHAWDFGWFFFFF